MYETELMLSPVKSRNGRSQFKWTAETVHVEISS
jgi:hypothetical protein